MNYTDKKTLIVASNNKGKIKEIKEILGEIYNVVSMAEQGINVEVEEDGATFEENAVKKAVEIHKLTGKSVLSDDSGLCVEALGGAPGVYSARYCGAHGKDDENTVLLLKNLANESNRKAKFVCCVALTGESGNTICAFGEVSGTIIYEKCGSNGFGYDPIFFSEELGKTFGEADAAEKNSISHRARALKNLLAIITK